MSAKNGPFTALMLTTLWTATVWAGNLNAPAAPTDPGSAMYGLDDVYNRLDTGEAGAKRTGAFTEPVSGPGSTGQTLDDVMGKAPAVDDASGATTAEVLQGKTFWGLRSDGTWGNSTGALATQMITNTTTVQSAGNYAAFDLATEDADLAAGNIAGGVIIYGVTGTANVATGDAVSGDVLTGKTFSNSTATDISGSMPIQAPLSITPSSTTQAIPGGYYSGPGSVAGDADLVAGNIRSGVALFGIAGDSAVINTAQLVSPAAATDIATGKIAFINGAQVTGSVPAGSNVDGTNGNLGMTIPDGIYSGSKTATAQDSNLLTGNIKAGTTIFGVSGKTEVVDTTSGDAISADLLTGKKAWVDGSEITGTSNISAYPALVPRTGQTPTVPFAAPTGSDGNLQKGVIWPNPRFTNNSDGTVTDNLTGLVWLENANCAAATRTWGEALTAVGDLNTDGTMNTNDCVDTSNGGSHQTDWRLPNRRELESLIDIAYQLPALSDAVGTGQWTAGDPFSGVQSTAYWSSSLFAGNSDDAWIVHLTNGVVDHDGNGSAYYVWPVRAGQ